MLAMLLRKTTADGPTVDRPRKGKKRVSCVRQNEADDPADTMSAYTEHQIRTTTSFVCGL